MPGGKNMGMLLRKIDIGQSEIPTLETVPNKPDEIQAVYYDKDGKRYYFSNELGHKVYTANSDGRPMTKREYKEVHTLMILKTLERADQKTQDQILPELLKLEFSLGHANSTFEINRPCIGGDRIGALIINKGLARYIYNADSNTVFHIDHSKHINGHFMQDGPEKDEIIDTITSSKTLQKKMRSFAN